MEVRHGERLCIKFNLIYFTQQYRSPSSQFKNFLSTSNRFLDNQLSRISFAPIEDRIIYNIYDLFGNDMSHFLHRAPSFIIKLAFYVKLLKVFLLKFTN